MLPTAIPWVVLIALQDAGRVEVDGLVIAASAKPPPSISYRPGAGGAYDVEMTVASKAGGAMPIYGFEGPIRAVGPDGRELSKPNRFQPGIYPSGTSHRWRVSLHFEQQPPKTLAAVEGTLSLARAQWKAVTFEGAALKRNTSVAIEGGSVKLIALDLDDPRPDLWFRVTLPAASSQSVAVREARLTAVDASGKESVLPASGGVNISSDGTTVQHRIKFVVGKRTLAEPLRRLRLELPMPQGASKKIAFRIPNVPVDQSGQVRK